MIRVLFCLCVVSWAVGGVFPSGDIIYTMTDEETFPYPKIVSKPASANESTPETLIFKKKCWNSNPRFSYDKKTVVFASGMDFSSHAAPTLTMLYTLPFPTGSLAKPQRVTKLSTMEYNEFAADWSSDNQDLVIEYTWHSALAGAAESNTRLATVSASNPSKFTPLMDNKKVSYNDWCARWNPVNRDILLFLSDRSGSTQIYLYNFQNNSATLLPLPQIESATDNCPFWDKNGKGFHYEVKQKGYFQKYPFMEYVDITQNPVTSSYEFQINLVNSVCCSGVPEYLQCSASPISSSSLSPHSPYFTCLKSSSDGDAISIIKPTGEFVKNITLTATTLYHMTPDWK